MLQWKASTILWLHLRQSESQSLGAACSRFMLSGTWKRSTQKQMKQIPGVSSNTSTYPQMAPLVPVSSMIYLLTNGHDLQQSTNHVLTFGYSLIINIISIKIINVVTFNDKNHNNHNTDYNKFSHSLSQFSFSSSSRLNFVTGEFLCYQSLFCTFPRSRPKRSECQQRSTQKLKPEEGAAYYSPQLKKSCNCCNPITKAAWKMMMHVLACGF